MNIIETAAIHSTPTVSVPGIIFPVIVLTTFLVSLAIGGGGLSIWLFNYFTG